MNTNNEEVGQQLLAVCGRPDQSDVQACHQQVRASFARIAPRISWDAVETPLGTLYLAATAEGISNVEIGLNEAGDFLTRLDPLACSQRDPDVLAPYTRQINEYFAHHRLRFEMRLDLSHLTPFQRRVLETIRAIPAGTVLTYSQVAKAIGMPSAARAVGQALHINPLLIVVPCHRVVASDGSLRGYRAGLQTKQRLLQFEGAI